MDDDGDGLIDCCDGACQTDQACDSELDQGGTCDDGTDIGAVSMGYVSVTPLHLDSTNYKAVVEMERWRFDL